MIRRNWGEERERIADKNKRERETKIKGLSATRVLRHIGKLTFLLRQTVNRICRENVQG